MATQNEPLFESEPMRPLKNLCDLAVIGGGMAGLTAARHAAQLGCAVTLFEGSGLFGGQVATLGHVDGTGAGPAPSGQDIAMSLLDQARKAQVRIVEAAVADLDTGKKLGLTDDSGSVHRPRAVIVASGASLRRLGVPGEAALAGRGVSRCATCDGGFFRGEDVVVVGGGDSALQEAQVLARTSRRVILVNRSPLRGQRHYVEALAKCENVSFVWDSEVSEIRGGTGVSGVVLRNTRSGETAELACSGVFAFIGVQPNTGFLPRALLTDDGHVAAGPDLLSRDPRVLAAGAVRAGHGGQVLQAMGEAVSAAQLVAARLLQ